MGRGRVGLDRSVGYVTIEICFFDDGGAPFALGQIAALFHHGRRWRGLLNVFENGPIVGTGGRVLEIGLDAAECVAGDIGPLMQDGDHAGVFHDLHAGDLFGRGSIHRFQPGAVRGRAQDGSVEQTRQDDVAGIFGLAGDFVGTILAGLRNTNQVESGGFHRHVFDVPLDAFSFEQLAISDGVGRRTRFADDAGLHAQPIDWHLQAFRRHLEQYGFGLRPGPANGRPEQGRGHGPERSHVVWAEAGIAQHHVYRVESDIQLLGERLGHLGHHTLAQFHLAYQARHPTVGRDLQKGVEIHGSGLAHRQPRRLLGLRVKENEQARSGGSEQAAARHAAGCDFSLCHYEPALAAAAAC